MNEERAHCCVVGGGPAGMMLGLLLARQGIRVTIVEKHADFLRDFRGDTIHPSTQELIHELGWLDEFHRIPHAKMHHVTVSIGGRHVTLADFRRLDVRAPYIVFMPQWDFLDFLARKAGELPAFRLRRSTEATDLIVEDGRVTGVRVRTQAGQEEIRADLIVAADGRHSRLRELSGLPMRAASPPMDVLWFRLSRDPADEVPFFQGGKGAMVAIDRGDYWQVAYTIPAGSYRELRSLGLAKLRTQIAALAPALRDRLHEIAEWDDVHHLEVRVDRLRRWHRDGLLCIGDAAHAMSPAGGVGINLAIQDAVATANLLGPKLPDRTLLERDLKRVQARRDLPARVTQRFQLTILRDLYPKSLGGNTEDRVPRFMTAFQRVPPLRRLMGRFIGLGVRPEHVQPHRPSRNPPLGPCERP